MGASRLCENSIEQRIDAILREKQELFDTVVDGVTLPIDRLLTQEELFGLFGLAPGR